KCRWAPVQAVEDAGGILDHDRGSGARHGLVPVDQGLPEAPGYQHQASLPADSDRMTVAVQQAGSWADLSAEAVRIVSEAGEAGVTLRVIGSAGIRLHCKAPGEVMDLLGRPAKDIDFVVPEKHRKGMRRYLESRGYVADRDLLIAMEGTRYSFTHAENGIELDVFVERLEFCHTIEIRSRLHQPPITPPVEEVMLAKLQIIEMTL